MADEDPRPRVDKTEIDIAELKLLVNTLIVEVVRPATETAVAAQERSLNNEQRFQNLLDEAREDRMNAQRQLEESRRRFDAQQEAIQAMLVQIASMNNRIGD